MDYKKLYFALYAEVNDVIERLQEIQRKYEDLYCSAEDKQLAKD
jgi:hypothetical protein